MEDNPNITLTLRLLWYSNICTQIMSEDFKYVAVMLDSTLLKIKVRQCFVSALQVQQRT